MRGVFNSSLLNVEKFQNELNKKTEYEQYEIELNKEDNLLIINRNDILVSRNFNSFVKMSESEFNQWVTGIEILYIEVQNELIESFKKQGFDYEITLTINVYSSDNIFIGSINSNEHSLDYDYILKKIGVE